MALKKFYEGQTLTDMLRILGDDYLSDTGWKLSADLKESVDREGKPLPWITYPAITFVSRLVRNDWRVFEYGAGNSTLWWRERCTVESVESDPEYAAHYGVRHAVGDAYVNAPVGAYDVVMIDGIDRNECAARAVHHLKPGGFILFDNSERPDYAEAYGLLKAAGFLRLDFFGLGPIATYGWQTSIFTKDLAALCQNN